MTEWLIPGLPNKKSWDVTTPPWKQNKPVCRYQRSTKVVRTLVRGKKFSEVSWTSSTALIHRAFTNSQCRAKRSNRVQQWTKGWHSLTRMGRPNWSSGLPRQLGIKEPRSWGKGTCRESVSTPAWNSPLRYLMTPRDAHCKVWHQEDHWHWHSHSRKHSLV